jgi:hypothetical protein
MRRWRLALLRKSLTQDADPDFYTWDRGYLVSAAVLQDKPEVLQVLINAGADVNVRKWNQSTPLLRAVHSSRCEAARLLLKAGASLDDRFYDYAELAEAPTYDKRTVREIYEGRKAEYPTSWERDAACWLQFEALMKNPPRSQWTLHRVFQQVVLLFI